MSMMVFQRGRKFSYQDRILVFDTALNYREVVLIDPASAEKIIAPVSELRPPTPVKAASEEEFTETELVEAQRRYKVIEPMLITLKDGSALYRQIAEKEGIAVSTLFRWRERYLVTGSITSLIDKPKGRKKGAKALDPVVEAIVNEIIDEKHMSQERWGPVSVLREVKAVMLERGVAKRYRRAGLAGCTAAGNRRFGMQGIAQRPLNFGNLGAVGPVSRRGGRSPG